MEAQVFTPDSRRLLLHRSAHPHGSDQHDPRHRYLVCDLTDACRLAPITHEIGATAPSLSPDGSALYYLVNETEPGGGRLTLKRVALDGTGRETLLVLDAPFPGTDYFPSQLYPLSTISSDGARFAAAPSWAARRWPARPSGCWYSTWRRRRSSWCWSARPGATCTRSIAAPATPPTPATS